MNLSNKETTSKIEETANATGMRGKDFVEMVLRDILTNEEHFKYYTHLAQEMVQKKIERDRAYLLRKYGKKK